MWPNHCLGLRRIKRASIGYSKVFTTTVFWSLLAWYTLQKDAKEEADFWLKEHFPTKGRNKITAFKSNTSIFKSIWPSWVFLFLHIKIMAKQWIKHSFSPQWYCIHYQPSTYDEKNCKNGKFWTYFILITEMHPIWAVGHLVLGHPLRIIMPSLC